MAAPIRSEELFGLWQQDRWASVYLLAGQEDYLIDQAIQKINQRFLGDDTSGLNLDRFDAEVTKAAVIVQAAQTIPFLGTHRVVRVDGAGHLPSAEQNQLAEALPRLSPETCLLLIWNKDWRRDDSKRALVEAVFKQGQVAMFWPLFPEQAQRWAVQRARHYKKDLSNDAAQYLVEQSSASLRIIDQELSKVSMFVGGAPGIDLDDIQASMGYERSSSPFDWVAAIRGKDVASASRILISLLEEGEEPYRLLPLLSRGVRDWLSAKSAGESASTLAMRMHLKRGEENRYLKDLGRWTESELVTALSSCLNAEQAIKNGKETPEISLSLLVLGLCGLQGAYALS